MTRSTLQSVTNAVRVLKAFSSSQRCWGVSDLARHLDIGKSTVHRLLSTLADEGILERDAETGKYRLGLAMFDLAAAVPTQLDLHEAVLNPLTNLRNRTGETSQIAVLDGREVVYIERLVSPSTLRTFLGVGRRNLAHCTASGKALLAFAPRQQSERILNGWQLEAVTVHTITSVPALRRELEGVRRRGFAENRQEAALGVVSVAAPIRDAGARTVAALSVAGPADRLDPLKDQLGFYCMDVAAQISKRLAFGLPTRRDADD